MVNAQNSGHDRRLRRGHAKSVASDERGLPGCRIGVCHTCETALIEGDVEYDPEPLDPPAKGDALICCCRPQSEVALDS